MTHMWIVKSQGTGHTPYVVSMAALHIVPGRIMAVSKPGCVIAQSPEAAIGHGIKAALELWPPEQGWSDHKVAVHEMTLGFVLGAALALGLEVQQPSWLFRLLRWAFPKKTLDLKTEEGLRDPPAPSAPDGKKASS